MSRIEFALTFCAVMMVGCVGALIGVSWVLPYSVFR